MTTSLYSVKMRIRVICCFCPYSILYDRYMRKCTLFALSTVHVSTTFPEDQAMSNEHDHNETFYFTHTTVATSVCLIMLGHLAAQVKFRSDNLGFCSDMKIETSVHFLANLLQHFHG